MFVLNPESLAAAGGQPPQPLERLKLEVHDDTENHDHRQCDGAWIPYYMTFISQIVCARVEETWNFSDRPTSIAQKYFDEITDVKLANMLVHFTNAHYHEWVRTSVTIPAYEVSVQNRRSNLCSVCVLPGAWDPQKLTIDEKTGAYVERKFICPKDCSAFTTQVQARHMSLMRCNTNWLSTKLRIFEQANGYLFNPPAMNEGAHHTLQTNAAPFDVPQAIPPRSIAAIIRDVRSRR